MRIIFDTNFLMIPGQFKVDIFQELNRIIIENYELCIFEETLEELQKIASKNTKDKMAANVALKLAKQKNLKILKNSFKKDSYVDDIIVENVQLNDIVCTQDKILRKRLKEKNIKIIVLKSKRYLDYGG